MSELKLKPLGKRIVIETLQAEEKTAGGIIIPDSAKEKPQQGKVLSIGKEIEKDGEIKIGDTVMYSKYSGTEITLDNKDFIILEKDNVLAIIK